MPLDEGAFLCLYGLLMSVCGRIFPRIHMQPTSEAVKEPTGERQSRKAAGCGHNLSGTSLHCLRVVSYWMGLGLIFVGIAPRIRRLVAFLLFCLNMLSCLRIFMFFHDCILQNK
jgi:hypothetical protein